MVKAEEISTITQQEATKWRDRDNFKQGKCVRGMKNIVVSFYRII